LTPCPNAAADIAQPSNARAKVILFDTKRSVICSTKSARVAGHALTPDGCLMLCTMLRGDE
jgi:hypothetical protein